MRNGKSLLLPGAAAVLMTTVHVHAQDDSIAHDAEYFIPQAQLSEQLGQDDAAVDAALAEFRERNGGKPPNISYLFINDIGFDDMGIREPNAVCSYETPNIRAFSDEAMRMVRMYTELPCTPTRVAFSTGRLPVRMDMGGTAVDISGFGLPGDEVTLAEVLKESGRATRHVGKWHMSDVAESCAMNQGFDYALHAVHQQGQMTVFNDHAIREQVSFGIKDFMSGYTVDNFFRPDASAMATVIEGEAGGQICEIRMEPGERWNAAKHDEMNQPFQDKTMEELRRIATANEPSFLQYCPMIPLDNTRTGRFSPESANGGPYADKMQLLDAYFGETFVEIETLEKLQTKLL